MFRHSWTPFCRQYGDERGSRCGVAPSRESVKPNGHATIGLRAHQVLVHGNVNRAALTMPGRNWT
jgi:hypothetical protein